MRSIIIVLTPAGGTSQTAILKTDNEGNGQRFTVMQVERPSGLTSDTFPFRYGDVYNIQELLQKLAELQAWGYFSISSITKEDADSSVSLTASLPVIKKVTVTVTNAGATLTIDGEVQSSLSWVGIRAKGATVAYKAELEGYTTQQGTLTVNTSDITESITLVEV